MIHLIVFIMITLVGGLIYRYLTQKKTLKRAKEIIAYGGISEVKEIQIGGEKQYILIEGKNKQNPIMLFLHGGPGQAFPFGVSSRSLFPEVTENFTAVFYDQRGAGKSYNKNIDKESMTIGRFISDTNEVVDYVRERFQEKKIYLVGMSFGTLIGTKLAHQYPEKFHAYIGLDQITHLIECQKAGMEHLLEHTKRSTRDRRRLAELKKIGLPPFFGKGKEKYSDMIKFAKGYFYESNQAKGPNVIGLVKGALLSPDYTLKDMYHSLVTAPKFNIVECDYLQEELIHTDLNSIKELAMPVYIIQGRHDLTTNFSLAQEFFERLRAPAGKEFIVLEHSAHIPNEQDFKMFLNIIRELPKMEPVRS
jgi:pimeloyl-ACP methyl ester carboxylesterase